MEKTIRQQIVEKLIAEGYTPNTRIFSSMLRARLKRAEKNQSN